MKKKTKPVTSWVVYQMALRGKLEGGRSVCEQVEWDAMERAQPGHYTLVQAGIPSEGEAEKLARAGTVGDTAGSARPRAR